VTQVGDFTQTTLALLGNTLLRTAITRNLVSFPAQIRPFMRRSSGDLQERIVQLYFLRGWSVRTICDRYGLSKAMTHKLIAEWRIRAVESGYIQEIEPGSLAAFIQETRAQETRQPETTVRETRLAADPPGAPVYVVPMNAPPPAGELAEFDFTNVVRASISAVENPVALSAGSGA
jgi:transposase-like protein